MARVVIGLVGKKQSGKTTSYNYLKEVLDPAIEIQLAKKLKDVCSVVFKVKRENFDRQGVKESKLTTPRYLTFWNIIWICFKFMVFPKLKTFKHIGIKLDTPRKILQYVGTEVLREIDNKIHLKRATARLPKSGVFIVSDVRFEDELKYLFDWSKPYGYFIYLDKNNNVLDMHKSEKVEDLAKYCYVLSNNGNIKDLHDKLYNFLIGVVNAEIPYIGLQGIKRQLEKVSNQ